MTSDLDSKLLEHIRSEHLVPEPGLALLAVSGGPDSLALLDLFHGVAGRLGLRLAVAHLDHGIHPSSGAVADRLRGMVERYGWPFYVEALHLGLGASETRARRERYRALRRIQAGLAARYLVTAHHADDQVETVLLRALKGTGMVGLAGIRARGPNGLVRPLLPFPQRALAEWLRARFPDPETAPVPFEDPANVDPRHERSWIRHYLLPFLRQRFGDHVDRRVLQLARHAAAERRAWNQVLRALGELEYRSEPEVWELARGGLQQLPTPLAEAVLRAAAEEAGALLGPKRSARLLAFARAAPSGRTLELGQGWVAELAFDRLRVLRRCRPAALPPCRVWGDDEGGSMAWDGWEFSWRVEAAGVPDRGGLCTWVTPGRGEVRVPAPGDRLVPVGGVGRRRVRRLLMEARVPAADRAVYPVLVRDGDILWLPGVCRGEGALPQPGRPALRLDARRVR